MDRTASNRNTGTELHAIVEQVQQGEVEAYTEIIRQFQRPIYLYCYYLLGSRQEAEDAAQDVFIKGLENIGGYVQKVSFTAWLYRIAWNHCMDLMKRRSKGFRLLAMYKKQQLQTEEAPASLGYTEQVHELLERLNMGERQILLLRALEDYSFNEIGAVMEMSPATVRKKYERLRKKLGRHTANGGTQIGEPFKNRG
ncbi:RNA polymerase sigma factor [Paenibacillus sp. P32E]|uniref:RNA polymerase sigma factor n=1 Tax=Paenibacillus sp. P32E TaxID=1349434 RepID=UPI000AFCB35D|nr:sigma-70 family RNA polymerase sigma factor [Paenibacillus sp. P32E]